jgi:hypothetical protein
MLLARVRVGAADRRPARGQSATTDPTLEWGPLGRTGCIVFVTVVLAIMVIAALIGATRSGPQAQAHGGGTFAATVPEALDP